MKIEHKGLSVILTPNDGFRFVTNGTIYSKIVYLRGDSDVFVWNDTNNDPPTLDDLVTEEDLENALTELGV